MNRLGKPQDQPDYQKGVSDRKSGKDISDNPYKDWMTKSASMKKIYWDLGFNSVNGENNDR
jgi:hypothetical protein